MGVLNWKIVVAVGFGMTENDQVIVDGQEQARTALSLRIKAQVESEYADELAQANWIDRLIIRRQIKLETKRRCDQEAPPDDALY